MQLRHARLCLNCEEIHTAAHCPVCTSESFAYVSRWIPPDERRQKPRTGGEASALPTRAVEQPTQHMRWVRRGAAGVALLAASRMLWQLSRPVEWSSADLPHDLEDGESSPEEEPGA